MFKPIADKVKSNYAEMIASQKPIFLVSFDKDTIWDKYLQGFTDPTVKQSYNCNCCKSFFRRYGGIVAINTETLELISPLDGLNSVISQHQDLLDDNLAKAISNVISYVKSCKIDTIALFQFDPKESMGGTYSCVANPTSTNYPGKTFYHFNIELPQNQIVQRQGEHSAASLKGMYRSKVETLIRCVKEFKISDTEVLLELIAQNSLYRGEEFKPQLEGFLKVQKQYAQYTDAKKAEKSLYLSAINVHQSITNIRNTAIGTLLEDVALGIDLDTAVTKYEKVVAPTNYKRPNAIATPKMVEDAKKTINELGYLESLNRRFAVESDLNVEDILFSYSSTQAVTEDIFNSLSNTTVNPKSFTKVTEMGIQDFINKVLPTAKKLEVLVEKRHKTNFMSVITAKDKTSKSMFKWNNQFSWSYIGGISDAIKERVKEAGGNIEGKLRISLAWHNSDDLDLHIYEPNGSHIYYGDKTSSYTKGTLDIDMNAGGPTNSTNPVENIIYPLNANMPKGKYQVHVNNFSKRSNSNQGYTVQVEFDGQIFEYVHKNNSDHKFYIEFDGENFTIGSEVLSKEVKSEFVWNLATYKFHTVSKFMLSPNHWGDNSTGNKHFMFLLEDCISEETPRPFLNEFLKPELEKHKRVFEILGGKLPIEENENQLSGLGFSETIRTDIFVKVTSKFESIIKIKF